MATESRLYSSRRQSIVEALVRELKAIDGSGEYLTNLDNNEQPKIKFWDEVEEFPAVHLNAESETREYQGGRYKDRFLNINIRCYVKSDESVEELDKVLEDVETVLEENARLLYFDKRGVQQHTHQITILSIDTDEGVLDPFGVGEILIEVQY